MINSRKLPSHWQISELGKVCKCVTGTTPSKNDSNNYGEEIPFLKPPQLLDNPINDAPEKLSKKGAEKARIIPINSVLVTCIGNLGRTAINLIPVTFNQQINAIIPSERTIGKFLFYQAQSPNFKIQLEGLSAATTVAIVNKSKFETIKIVIPPIHEQQAIVSKLEELLSDLEFGKQQLQIAQQQLNIYRQSLLKWAFEGKLTNENLNGELPKGWIFKKFNEIGTWKGGGTPSKSRKDFWANGNIFWVSPKDMKTQIINDTIDKITNEAIENSSAKLITKGSILFVVRSGILRRTLPVSLTICDVTVNQDLIAFTPYEAIPEYIYWYSIAKNDDIRKNCSKDGTTVESIDSLSLKNYSIPICSLNEQQQIVYLLESKLSVCNIIEETILQSLLQAESLRQSILKKTFEGKLI